MIRLGVNVDHVATVRQARRIDEPDPVQAAVLAELGGADGITVHLREDRRHISDRDVRILRETVKSSLNLEMAMAEEMVGIALDIRPDQITLVPEKREEITTEGGLDLIANQVRCREVVARLRDGGAAHLCAFVDPETPQIEAAAELGFEAIEINTGAYCEASGADATRIATEIGVAGKLATDARMGFHAGHGLNTLNVIPIARLEGLEELNIGHSIVGRALFVGFEAAVREMKQILVRIGG